MADIRFLSYPKFQAFDDNGAPLSGGEVEIFAAGTSTQITTWKDANKSAANTNPVSLNARGEADIWFDQSAKIILRDSSGTQIWSKDDISPLNAQTVTGKYNLVENGSFELDGDGDGDPDNWTISLFNSSTSTVEIDTSEVVDGVNSLKFVSQGDGGGTATSTRFSVPNGANIGVTFFIKSTKADVRNIVKVKYYDKNGSNTSTTTLYDDSSTNPTSWTQKIFTDTVPGSSTQAELILIGCDSSDSTSGTTYYDLAQVLTQSYVFTGTPGEVTASAADINNIDGLTATAAELNTLDGYTGATSDLNKLDGYSGDIPTAGWVEIEEKAADGSGNIDFTGLDSTYDLYWLEVDNIVLGGSNALSLRTSTDGGTSFDSGSSDYTDSWNIIYYSSGNSSAQGGGSNDDIRCWASLTVKGPFHGGVYIYRPADSSVKTAIRSEIAVTVANSAIVGMATSVGQREEKAAVDAIQLRTITSETIDSGTARLHGWKRP